MSSEAEMLAVAVAVADGRTAADDLNGLIVGHVPHGLCLTRASDRVILAANPRFEDMFGLRPGVATRARIEAVGDEGSESPAVWIQDRFVQDVTQVDHSLYEGKVLRPNGSRWWCRISVSEFDDARHGRLTLTVFDDITRYKEAELALRGSESRLAEAQRLGRIGSWERDVRTDEAVWSEESCRIFGVDPATFVPSSDNFFALIHPEDRERVKAVIADSSALERDYEVEYRIVRPDGEERVIFTRATLIRGADGTIAKRAGTAQDITDERRADEALRRYARELEEANHKLEEVNRLKDHFIAVTNHELRTPLTSVLGFAATLETHWEVLSDEEKLDCIRKIRRNGDRLTELIGDILLLSASEAGALRLLPAPQDLQRLISDAIAQAGIDPGVIVVECPPDLAVEADRGRVLQILTNLMTNALKHGSAPLCVEARASGERAEIRVRDEGEGVPEELEPRLFEKFAPSRRGERGNPGGWGLGLAIVKELAEAHGGRAWYERGDVGACFGFTLPLA